MYTLLRPFLFMLPPEAAHNLVLWALRLGLGPKVKETDPEILKTIVCGMTFPNPLGLSSGFDKNAVAIPMPFDMGFGFNELGGVTPKPQPGNPRPRIFRCVEQETLINRMGFPNSGLDVIASRIAAYRETGQGILGINIAKNTETEDHINDYCMCIRTLAPLVDFFVVNVSCPNVKNFTAMQEKEDLLALLKAVKDERDQAVVKPPVFVKLSLDLTPDARADIAEIILNLNIDGLVCSNSSRQRPEALPEKFASEQGGLSGPHVRDMATDLIRDMYRLTHGTVPIIGVGGISCAADAYEKIRAGASLLQLYTALVYKGPGVVQDIKNGLVERLQADGYTSVSEAVGADVALAPAKTAEWAHG